jgi:hypothetical protein
VGTGGGVGGGGAPGFPPAVFDLAVVVECAVCLFAVFAAGVFPTSPSEVGGVRSGTRRQCPLTAFVQADGTRSGNSPAQRPHAG